DVDLGERLMRAPAQLLPRLLERHRVRAGVARLEARERAEQTTGDADVRRLEADVEIEVRPRAVALLALAVGEPPDGEEIGTVEEPDAVAQREALTRLQLVGNVSKASGMETPRNRVIG